MLPREPRSRKELQRSKCERKFSHMHTRRRSHKTSNWAGVPAEWAWHGTHPALWASVPAESGRGTALTRPTGLVYQQRRAWHSTHPALWASVPAEWAWHGTHPAHWASVPAQRGRGTALTRPTGLVYQQRRAWHGTHPAHWASVPAERGRGTAPTRPTGLVYQQKEGVARHPPGPLG